MRLLLGLLKTSTNTTHEHLWLLLLLLVLPHRPFAAGVLDPVGQVHAAVDGTFPVGNDGQIVAVFGDSDPELLYSRGWNVRTSYSLNLTDATEHVTITPSATLSFQFRGTALSLIGTVGPNHGAFSVLVDSTLHADQSSKAKSARTGQTLFSIDGLAEDDTHSFKLTHEDERGVELDVDAIVVWGDAGTAPSPTPATATTIGCSGGTPSPLPGQPAGKHYSKSFTDSGGIGFPFSCPTSAASSSSGSSGSSSSSSSSSVPFLSMTLSGINPSSLQTGLPSSTILPNGHHHNDDKHVLASALGGVLGGLVGVTAIAAGVVFYRRRQAGQGGKAPLPSADLLWGGGSGSSSASAVNGDSSGQRRSGEMVEAFSNGITQTLKGNDHGVGNGLGTNGHRPGLQDLAPRSFDVMRPVKAFAPISNHPFAFSAMSPSMAGSPAYIAREMGSDGGGSRPGSSSSNLPTTPSSDLQHQIGTPGSSSGHGHTRKASSIDPYLDRRDSVLSVRNPDASTEEYYSGDGYEELVGVGDARSIRSGREGSRSPEQGHSRHPSTSGEDGDLGGTAWPAEPLPIQPVIFGGPSSSRRPISTLYEGDEPVDSPAQTPYLDNGSGAANRSRVDSLQTITIHPSDHRSPFDTPQGGSGTGALRRPPLFRIDSEGPKSVPIETPMSVQDLQFSEERGYFTSRGSKR